MVRYFVCATALLAALVAGTAFAQPGGGGGRGNRGGFGGPGGGRGLAAMLLAIPEVQKELNITDDQKKQIETAGTDIRKEFQNAAGGGTGTRPNFRDMTQEERDKAMADMRTRMEKVGKAMDDKLSKILTPDQTTRLKQLELQSQGASALTTPDVIAKLKLTDDQQTKIKKIVDDSRGQRGQRGQGGQGGTAGGTPPTNEQRQAAAAQRREQRSKTLKDALAVLDDDQLVQWGEMSGKEFKFPDNMGNRGNRGNRNRGNRGGNPAPGGTPAPQST